jgi:signal transduction histidine kinase
VRRRILTVTIGSSLLFVQIEAGKMTLESTDFDIVGLMENLVDIMSVQSAMKGVELALDLPGMIFDCPPTRTSYHTR